MATLYVENVPDDLYAALKNRARERRHSVAAEIVSMLRENIPTAEELESRRKFFQKVLRYQSRKPLTAGPFPSTEEMVREDRAR
jgi:plasmid stability protein